MPITFRIPQTMQSDLSILNNTIISCRKCDRLIKYCDEISHIKRRMYIDEDYWGKPVPSFGDPAAQILIVGLAPAAHGANRTGRMFTGDRSGLWLFDSLNKFGFSNNVEPISVGDGVILSNVYITAMVHCAPPGNKPSKQEIDTCSLYLKQEMALLENLKIIVALGRIAFDGYLKSLKAMGYTWDNYDIKPRFGHGSIFRTPDDKMLIASFHPSQQNTQTGRLTKDMFDGVFRKVCQELDNNIPG